MTKYKVGDEVVFIDPTFYHIRGKDYVFRVEKANTWAWIYLFDDIKLDALDDRWITKASKLHKVLK